MAEYPLRNAAAGRQRKAPAKAPCDSGLGWHVTGEQYEHGRAPVHGDATGSTPGALAPASSAVAFALME
jgi:hypothetical protein